MNKLSVRYAEDGLPRRRDRADRIVGRVIAAVVWLVALAMTLVALVAALSASH